jgi:hypothetical protein
MEAKKAGKILVKCGIATAQNGERVYALSGGFGVDADSKSKHYMRNMRRDLYKLKKAINERLKAEIELYSGEVA